MKILEANGTEITNLDGAEFNNLVLGRKNGVVSGVLNGLQIVAATQNSVAISSGLLIVQGFRIKFEEEISIPVTPVSPDRIYYLIGSLLVKSDKSVSFTVSMRTTSNLTQNALFQSESGTYEVKLAEVVVGTNGIQKITKTITNL